MNTLIEDTMWKAHQREDHARYLAGKKPFRIHPRISDRRAIDFELALQQRGEAAKASFEKYQEFLNEQRRAA